MVKIVRYFLKILLPMSVLGGAVVVHLTAPTPLELLRLKVFDTYQRLQPRTYEPLPVTIIDIDEASLSRLGQWPWPRHRLAELTQQLFVHGSASVGYDIVFAEEDRTSPTLLLPQWESFLGKDATQHVNPPDYDRQFGDAITNGNVVTGFVLSDFNFEMPAKKFGMVFKGDPPFDSVFPYAGAVSTLPVLTEGAAGNGALNAIPDTDGLIRKVPILMRVRDQFLPGLAAETLRTAQGASTYIVTTTPTGVEQVRIGAFDIPTDRHGHVWVHFTPYQQERYIPAWEVLEEGFDSTRLEGHLVLIGTSAAGLKDIRATPLDPVTNGVEVHTQALEQILTGHYLQRPDWIEAAELLTMIAAGVMVWALVAFASPSIGAIGTVIILIGAFGVSWFGFLQHRMLIDPVSPGITIGLLYLVESLRRYMSSERERRQVRSAFSHYMSPALVEQLAAHPDALKLGGEMKEMTVLFCDIRGFTTISEQFDAEGLTQFINRFLTPMTEVILSRQGTIDKYMGDCIMAFWNAPLDDANHAVHACEAALAMQHDLIALNEKLKEEASAQGHRFIPVQIGIGLNTDACCVGNMGSQQRFDYSVLGDGVNLASRLEGQSKQYGVTIVIGENTRQAAQDVAAIELDLIMVKGKTEAVRIYGLLGDKEMAQTTEWQALAQANDAMLQSYRAQDWDRTETELTQMEAAADALSIDLKGYVALYHKRITAYRNATLPDDWDGVYIAMSK